MFGRHFKTRGAQGCGPAAAFGRGPLEHWGRHLMEHRLMGELGLRRPKYNVPMNVANHDTHYEAHLYATGFDKADIKLTVTDDVLYITGTRTLDGPEPNFTKQEFPVKNFERMLNLHGQVDTAAISARQENGVLIITLPKTQQAQQPAQEIKVN